MVTITVYEDQAGEWRWRLRPANGRTFCGSEESFASLRNAKRAAGRMGAMLGVPHRVQVRYLDVEDYERLIGA